MPITTVGNIYQVTNEQFCIAVKNKTTTTTKQFCINLFSSYKFVIKIEEWSLGDALDFAYSSKNNLMSLFMGQIGKIVHN